MSHDKAHTEAAAVASPDAAANAAAAMKERIRTLRLREEERQKARDVKALERELVEAELVEKYSNEIGERGVYWQIFSTPEGFVVCKLGDWAHYKRYILSKSVNNMPTPEEAQTFATACLVYPDVEAFRKLSDRFGGFCYQICIELVRMYEARNKGDEGK